MTTKLRRVLMCMGAILSPVVLIAGLTLFVHSEGLDRTNMWSGIASMVIGLAGLILTVFGARGQAQGSNIRTTDYKFTDCENVVIRPKGRIRFKKVIYYVKNVMYHGETPSTGQEATGGEPVAEEAGRQTSSG